MLKRGGTDLKLKVLVAFSANFEEEKYDIMANASPFFQEFPSDDAAPSGFGWLGGRAITITSPLHGSALLGYSGGGVKDGIYVYGYSSILGQQKKRNIGHNQSW